MSDPTTQATSQTQPSVGELISRASEKVWRRLREALGVPTREAAVQLVAQDNQAAETARTILETTPESLLGKDRKPSGKSILGGVANKVPTAQLLYGPKGGGISL